MGIESVIDADVSLSQIALAQERFGEPLVLASHAIGVGGPLVVPYRSLQEAVTAGHVAGSLVYKILAKIFGQRRRPRTVLVGRRRHSWTQVVSLTPLITTTDYVYRFRINGALFTYTVLAGATATSISTALRLLINASSLGAAVAAVVGSACVVTTATANTIWEYTELPMNPMAFDIEDQTPEANIADDLGDVMDENAAWYGLVTDVTSKAAVTAVATAIETTRKIYVSDVHDSDVLDPGSTTDTAATLQAQATMRTYLQYHPDVGAYGSAALLSRRLTTDPGADTWAFVRLALVRAYSLNAAQEAALKAKNVGSYTVIASRGTTLWGKSVGGMYVDLVRGIDWLFARLRERLFALLVARSEEDRKLPLTDVGIAVVSGVVETLLIEASNDPHNLTVEDSIIVQAPRAADIPEAERAERNLPDIVFSADVQNAVHTMSVRGVLRS